MLTPDRELEILRTGKYQRVVGIDEVGRGCWAGPVAVGAFIFSSGTPTIAGVNDSKQVSPQKRQKIYQELKQGSNLIKMSPAERIDKIGIAVAIAELIAEIIQELNDGQTLFVIDGHFTADFGADSIQVVGGDRIFYSVASASILAKVERDMLMSEMDEEFPGYGLAQHKGYGTTMHMKALQSMGGSKIHRYSYKPVARLSRI